MWAGNKSVSVIVYCSVSNKLAFDSLILLVSGLIKSYSPKVILKECLAN